MRTHYGWGIAVAILVVAAGGAMGGAAAAPGAVQDKVVDEKLWTEDRRFDPPIRILNKALYNRVLEETDWDPLSDWCADHWGGVYARGAG